MKIINDKAFFQTNTIDLAKNLIGKWIKTYINGEEKIAQILETEAYLGECDSACHSFNGRRTARTEPMFREGGTIYIYLCYGIHYLLNIVSLKENQPEAVLIRAVSGANGPAKTTKFLNIDKSLNFKHICFNDNICILDDGKTYSFKKEKRVGIPYANPKDKNAFLRFILK